jgi:sugar O-acyltransferase (sialic acid O-acetyltransferase NeuD family)
MQRSILFLGDGTSAVEALDIAEAAGGFTPLGFVNSIKRAPAGSTLEGLPIFWIDEIPFGPADCVVVCAIVTTRRIGFIEDILKRGYRFTSLLHPSASVSRRARIGDGCILKAGVVVGSNADIGEYTLINRGALIGHDVLIKKCCTIGPGANIAGDVEVGEGALVAQGAIIRERVKIGNHAVVGAGALVLEDVGDNDMVTGVPARVVRSGVDGH